MKRFTATEKWDKPWFQELPPHLKCLWNLMCDKADAAGVWEPNWKLASLCIGKTVSATDLSFFKGRIATFKGGKILIGSFVEFQYGKLSRECRAHIPIFRAIEKHSLSNGYLEAIHSLKEKEQETEEEKEPEKDSAKPMPEVSSNGNSFPESFDEFWAAYPRKIGKGDAERMWEKYGCRKFVPKILTSIRKAKISEDWTKNSGQFVPHPATWLNRKGWEDEGMESSTFTLKTNGPPALTADDI